MAASIGGVVDVVFIVKTKCTLTMEVSAVKYAEATGRRGSKVDERAKDVCGGAKPCTIGSSALRAALHSRVAVGGGRPSISDSEHFASEAGTKRAHDEIYWMGFNLVAKQSNAIS